MVKFTVDAVLPLIFRFLVKSGYQKTATKLQKETDIDLSEAVSQRITLDDPSAQEEVGCHNREIRQREPVGPGVTPVKS